MRSGRLPNKYGKPYLSTGDYIKDFKAFWHWHQKVEKKKGNEVKDIVEDLSTRGEKPKFVYFTEEEFNQMVEKASVDLKPILILAFTTGARPSEIVNITVGDFSEDFKSLTIRDEVSKTFGRRIKIILGAEQIKGYVEKFGLGKDDFVARMKLSAINTELRQLGKKILSKEKIQFKNLSLLDFRHSSCCFWLSRYKSENALKYKFGWIKSDKIHYYSEFLGMKDTINEDDLYIDVTKTELEKELAEIKQNSVSKKDVIDLVNNLLKTYNINPKNMQIDDAIGVFEK
jgi:integrase